MPRAKRSRAPKKEAPKLPWGKGSVLKRKGRSGLWYRFKDPLTGSYTHAALQAEEPGEKANEEALAILAEREAEHARLNDPTRITLAAFLADHYVPDYARTVTQSTLTRSAPDFKRAAAYFGDRAMKDITREDMREFFDWLKTEGGRASKKKAKSGAKVTGKPLSAATRRRNRAALRPVFALAVEKGFADKNPFDGRGRRGVWVEPVPRRKVPSLTMAQLDELLEQASDEYHDPIMLIMDTGLRREAAAMTAWEDLAGNFLTGEFEMLTPNRDKTMKNVPTIALTPRLQAMLARRFETRVAGEPRVFPEVTVPGLWQHWVRLRKRLGHPTLRIHDLRHLLATALLREGADPQDVADLLGHTTVRMVYELYGNVRDETGPKRAIRLLNRRRRRECPETMPPESSDGADAQTA